MWLRDLDQVRAERGHRCSPPSLYEYSLLDYKSVTKMRWMCDECRRVYKPWEDDYGYQWARLWPWSERRWRKRLQK